MYEFKINIGKEMAEMLKESAGAKNMSVESFIEEILNRYFVPLHSIDQEEMAKGYEEMGEINLSLAK